VKPPAASEFLTVQVSDTTKQMSEQIACYKKVSWYSSIGVSNYLVSLPPSGIAAAFD
jgi:hypothetical protein